MSPARHHRNVRLPLWCRVWLAAAERADAEGHSRWSVGELRRTVDPSGTVRAQEVSRALAAAVARGLLAPGSTARSLRLQIPPTSPRAPRPTPGGTPRHPPARVGR